jgi:predicted branched-subunit amino acid permease
MSLIVYSGASQFAIVGLVAAGVPWLVTAATALVLGARYVIYGPSLAPHLRGFTPPTLRLRRLRPHQRGLRCSRVLPPG